MFLGYQNGKITFYTDKKLDKKLYNLDKVVETKKDYVYNPETKSYVLNNKKYKTKIQKEERKAEILKELEDIDFKSIRAIRANEKAKLKELEAQAVKLREELANL